AANMPRACERAARGRLIAQGTACWRACAERREARKAKIERLFVGREKNLCELTRAHASNIFGLQRFTSTVRCYRVGLTLFGSIREGAYCDRIFRHLFCRLHSASVHP